MTYSTTDPLNEKELPIRGTFCSKEYTCEEKRACNEIRELDVSHVENPSCNEARKEEKSKLG